MSDLDWQDHAACRGYPPERFFRLGPVPADIARLCRRCPVRRACLAFALRTEGDEGSSTRHGIWGGLTPAARARIARRRRAA